MSKNISQDYKTHVARSAIRSIIEATPGWDIINVGADPEYVHERNPWVLTMTNDGGETLIQFSITITTTASL